MQGISNIAGWVSPRLGVRFELGDELEIYTPNNKLFLSPLEIAQRADQLEIEADQVKLKMLQERDRADAAEQENTALRTRN